MVRHRWVQHARYTILCHAWKAVAILAIISQQTRARKTPAFAHTVKLQLTPLVLSMAQQFALEVRAIPDSIWRVPTVWPTCAAAPMAPSRLARSAQHTALRCAPHARASTTCRVVCASQTRSVAASNTRLSRPRAVATASARITRNAALDSTRAWHRRRRRTATARHTRRAWLGSTR